MIIAVPVPHVVYQAVDPLIAVLAPEALVMEVDLLLAQAVLPERYLAVVGVRDGVAAPLAVDRGVERVAALAESRLALGVLEIGGKGLPTSVAFLNNAVVVMQPIHSLHPPLLPQDEPPAGLTGEALLVVDAVASGELVAGVDVEGASLAVVLHLRPALRADASLRSLLVLVAVVEHLPAVGALEAGEVVAQLRLLGAIVLPSKRLSPFVIPPRVILPEAALAEPSLRNEGVWLPPELLVAPLAREAVLVVALLEVRALHEVLIHDGEVAVQTVHRPIRLSLLPLLPQEPQHRLGPVLEGLHQLLGYLRVVHEDSRELGLGVEPLEDLLGGCKVPFLLLPFLASLAHSLLLEGVVYLYRSLSLLYLSVGLGPPRVVRADVVHHGVVEDRGEHQEVLLQPGPLLHIPAQPGHIQQPSGDQDAYDADAEQQHLELAVGDAVEGPEDREVQAVQLEGGEEAVWEVIKLLVEVPEEDEEPLVPFQGPLLALYQPGQDPLQPALDQPHSIVYDPPRELFLPQLPLRQPWDDLQRPGELPEISQVLRDLGGEVLKALGICGWDVLALPDFLPPPPLLSIVLDHLPEYPGEDHGVHRPLELLPGHLLSPLDPLGLLPGLLACLASPGAPGLLLSLGLALEGPL